MLYDILCTKQNKMVVVVVVVNNISSVTQYPASQFTQPNRVILSRRDTPLCDLNGDVRPYRVWFSGCFVLNGVSISTLSVLNRVSLHYLMA